MTTIDTRVLRINGTEHPEILEFGWDGCHKFYAIRSPQERVELMSNGWETSDIFPVSKLPELWEESCGLKFINSADLKDTFISQFEDAEVTYQ